VVGAEYPDAVVEQPPELYGRFRHLARPAQQGGQVGKGVGMVGAEYGSPAAPSSNLHPQSAPSVPTHRVQYRLESANRKRRT
jgi:hypothetical protein